MKYPRWIICRNGVIISKKLNRPRKLFKNNSGYLMVTDRDRDAKTKNYYVHRIVAEAFIGEIPKGMAVNHIDGDKTNNHIRNLEIITYSENIRHADANGLRECAKGEDNGSSKLSNIEAEELIIDIKNGAKNKDLAVKYNLHPQYISLIRHRRRWGWMWERVEGVTTSRKA